MTATPSSRLGRRLVVANATLTAAWGLLLLTGIVGGVRSAAGVADVATAALFWGYLVGTPLLAVLASMAGGVRGFARYLQWVLVLIWLGFLLWTATVTI